MARLLLIILIILGVSGGVWWWLEQRNIPINQAPPFVSQSNFKEMEEIITTDPLWYQHPRVKPKLDEYFREEETGKSEVFIKEKRAFIQLVGNMLEEGKVKLGEPLENFDEGRQPVNLLVIHHTETSDEANLAYINAIHLFTLYIIPAFDNPENSLYGKPVFSGHYDSSGKQVFYGYHYLVRKDGTSTQVLRDEYLGYHARSANSYSIGVALIGSFNENPPTEASLQTVREILQKYPDTQVLGHREVVSDTECPGDTFLGPGGWKSRLF